MPPPPPTPPLSASFRNLQSNRRFFSNQGCVTLRLMIRSGQFWYLSATSFPVQIIYKFQEQPIKTEGFKVMTKSKRGLFSNQGGHNSKINDPNWPQSMFLSRNIQNIRFSYLKIFIFLVVKFSAYSKGVFCSNRET